MRANPIVFQFLNELDSFIKRIKINPDSTTLMFPSANVTYGLINPELISSSRLAENVCCVLGGQEGRSQIGNNGEIEKITMILPIFAFFYIERDFATDSTGKNILKLQYNFVQEFIDLCQDQLCNWDVDVTATVDGFDLGVQVGDYDVWYYDTPILPPYYCTMIRLNLTLEGSEL